MLLSDKIAVHKNEKGRAVFARRDIARRETIEVCPVLVVYEDFWEMRGMKPEPRVGEWAFYWPKTGEAVIALGAGSLYNHSYKPNAHWRCRTVQGDKYIELYAHKNITAQEEITINYLGKPGARGKLDFPVIETDKEGRILLGRYSERLEK